VINVALLSVIRRWHLRDGISIREISRRTGLSRNTVRHFCRQANALAKRRLRVDGFANVHGVWTRLALHCKTGISPMDSKQDSTLVYQAAMVAVLPKALV